MAAATAISGALSSFKRFELIAHAVVDGFLTGFHKSPFKGFAIEFAEHRQYVPGDDLKHLDWKVLGKLNRFVVKQYEEDTSLRAYLLLDVSGSMGYGGTPHNKLDYGRFICGVLTYLLLMQRDSVGLMTFDNAVRSHLPPGSTNSQFKRITDALAASHPGTDTDLAAVLHGLAKRLKRRALLIVISDFFDNIDDIVLALNHFKHKKHEVILFQPLDRREATFPFADTTRFESLENSEFQLVDPIRLRQAYLAQFEAHQYRLRQACYHLRIDLVPMFTDEPFELTMARYLAGRLRR